MSLPRKIKDAPLMREYFESYAIDTKEHPYLITDWVGGMAKEVTRKKEKPLTMVGFENWLCRKGIICCLKDYFDNKDEMYHDFIEVCQYIRNSIKQDQIEGGMANIYNHSITARLNGLSDKIEQTNIEQPLFPDVPKDKGDK